MACLKSSDPEVVSFARTIMEQNLKLGIKKLESLNWAPITRAMRNKTGYRNMTYRDPDPSQGDIPQVPVFCRQCGFTTLDTTPVFHIYTGAYVVRKGSCYTCELNPGDVRHGRKRARRILYPVNPIAYIPWYRLQRPWQPSYASPRLNALDELPPGLQLDKIRPRDQGV
ncbi:uncharacterized protein B0T15DRAFT_496987 [Chaetomium strumarium]|uniref:Uncharacterized protein n=1 Tax=Chaetomium strumarium TaxID=1170767 RepID=A0AAJ0GM90_9PEZI|nr:hypothetical protein B0T15DRAFT_496987 [Chaetomium strumarium]